MFFISRGDVCVFVVEESQKFDGRGEPPEETYIISLGTGSFFGEVALLGEVSAAYRVRFVRAKLRGYTLH